jgi:maleate cis-trans isomerase
MIPANNTTMEPELLQWLPGSTCQTLRVPRGEGLLTAETVPAYKERALDLARAFRDVDAVVYGCTAACFITGRSGDLDFASRLEDITGSRVVTTGTAMADVLASANAVAVVTPYAKAVNDSLERFLADAGIKTRKLSSFDAANVEELARITAEEVAQRARETVDEQCDALFIACSQLPTYDIVAGLKEEMRRPVWSSIQAAAFTVSRSVASGR